MVENNNIFKFYTIDNFLYSNISQEQKSIDGASGRDNYLENIDRLGVSSFIHTIISDSLEAINNFEDKSVYCLFVDDSHHYGDVKRQLELWIDKIIDGGMIIGDDYNCDGVRRAFDETFGERVILKNNDSGCIVYF